MSEQNKAPSAAEFVNDLVEQAERHRAVNHPYLEALASGDLPDPEGAIRDFAYQYLVYGRNFTRYLTGAIAQLTDVQHRQSLVDNLAEETGHLHDSDREALAAIGVDPEWVDGVPHPKLFRRFVRALGVTDEELAAETYCDEAVIWSGLLLSTCSTAGAGQAVGAIGPGTETIVKFIYQRILTALDRHTSLTREERVFFDLHAELDDEHGEVLNNIAIDLAADPAQRKEIRRGMLTALYLRESFFDAMLRRALAMPARRRSTAAVAARA